MAFISISDPPKRGFNRRRKMYHIAGLLVPVMLYFDVFRFLDDDPFISRKVVIGLLIAANIVLFVMEYFRLNHSGFRDFFNRMFGPLMKPSEQNRIHGTVAYMISNLILVLFFSDEVVALSLTFLVLADPLAALVGIYFGRLRFFNGKTLEGLLAFIIASTIYGMIFYLVQDFLGRGMLPFTFAEGHYGTVFFILIFSTVVSALAEFFSFTTLYGLVDDNLIVPLAAAFAFAVSAVAIAGFPKAIVFFDLSLIL